MRPSSLYGFTLIELLMAVTVVAILAAIAIPSYSAYVIRGQRAAAKAALEQAAQFLERNYTTSGCYNYGAVGDCTAQGGPSAFTLPVSSSPNDGPATYAITVVFGGANPGQSFQLSAAPCQTSATACAAGANTSFNDPTCGALTLDNTGLQGVDTSGTGTGTPTTTGATVSTCWQH